MACWNKRRWYVEDSTGTFVLVRDTIRGLAWKNKRDVVAPALFASSQKARMQADLHDGITKYFDQKAYKLSLNIPF